MASQSDPPKLLIETNPTGSALEYTIRHTCAPCLQAVIPISSDSYVICYECTVVFHRECVDVYHDRFICDTCLSNQIKQARLAIIITQVFLLDQIIAAALSMDYFSMIQLIHQFEQSIKSHVPRHIRLVNMYLQCLCDPETACLPHEGIQWERIQIDLSSLYQLLYTDQFNSQSCHQSMAVPALEPERGHSDKPRFVKKSINTKDMRNQRGLSKGPLSGSRAGKQRNVVDSFGAALVYQRVCRLVGRTIDGNKMAIQDLKEELEGICKQDPYWHNLIAEPLFQNKIIDLVRQSTISRLPNPNQIIQHATCIYEMGLDITRIYNEFEDDDEENFPTFMKNIYQQLLTYDSKISPPYKVNFLNFLINVSCSSSTGSAVLFGDSWKQTQASTVNLKLLVHQLNISLFKLRD